MKCVKQNLYEIVIEDVLGKSGSVVIDDILDGKKNTPIL
jgi:hypothetical protein